ncbi:Uncharacterised protein [Mycobacteroides abscessus subsp. abscessus]|nr:Uncharacterised protein [Mycobacteroides abscessus subsp. abscessus]
MRSAACRSRADLLAARMAGLAVFPNHSAILALHMGV